MDFYGLLTESGRKVVHSRRTDFFLYSKSWSSDLIFVRMSRRPRAAGESLSMIENAGDDRLLAALSIFASIRESLVMSKARDSLHTLPMKWNKCAQPILIKSRMFQFLVKSTNFSFAIIGKLENPSTLTRLLLPGEIWWPIDTVFDTVDPRLFKIIAFDMGHINILNCILGRIGLKRLHSEFSNHLKNRKRKSFKM